MVHTAQSLDSLKPTQLRELSATLLKKLEKQDAKLAKQTLELAQQQTLYQSLKAEHTELMGSLTDKERELLFSQIKVDQLTSFHSRATGFRFFWHIKSRG